LRPALFESFYWHVGWSDRCDLSSLRDPADRPHRRDVTVLDGPAIRGAGGTLAGRCCVEPAATCCRLRPAFEIHGEDWTVRVSVDGTDGRPELPVDPIRALGAHLEGVIGAL
jgi:hypothetical protein